MVVYEIKTPSPFPSPTAPPPRVLEQPVEILPVARVRHLRREWMRRRYPQKEVALGAGSITARERELRHLITQANDGFASAAIAIHLVLHRKPDGFTLDIYDCSDKDVCAMIADKTFPLDNLPELIRNLLEQAGLIIDAVL